MQSERRSEGEPARVRQVAYVVRRADKLAALGRILDLEDATAALVFARTRGEVDDLAEGAHRGQLTEETFDERGSASSQSAQINNACHFCPPSLVSLL